MRKKILVADDEPDILRTIAIMLESEGYEVATALDGEETVKKIAANTPDLIILDMILPKINGREIAELLKNMGRGRKIPLIVITAQAQRSEKESLKCAGADCCLIKPFDLYLLKDKIESLLNGGNNNAE